MAYSSIPDSWREVGKAIKKDLIDLIHGNLEDLNGRITNVEGSVSTTLIANQLVSKQNDHAVLGTIIWSPLDQTTLNNETQDGEWKLCDGSAVLGSDYQVLFRGSVPDVRGKFMRMKAHGTGTTYNADGDYDTDGVQTSTNVAHTHTMNHGHSHTIAASGTFASSTHRHNIAHVHIWGRSGANFGDGEFLKTMTLADTTSTSINTGALGSTAFRRTDADPGLGGAGFTLVDENANEYEYPSNTGSRDLWTTGVVSGPSGTGSSALSGVANATSSVSTSGSVTDFSGSTASSGNATESRPHNITENAFIKINRNYIKTKTGIILWRAPQAITINQVIVTPVTQGTSGTLTIDIKKGPLSAISTSIFDTLPTLAYNDTDPQTGVLNGTNAQIEAGEYVRVDITTTQAKLKEFHILIGAAPE